MGTDDAMVAMRSAALRNLLWVLALWHVALWLVVIPFVAANKPAVARQSLVGSTVMLIIPLVLELRGHTTAACRVFVFGGSVLSCITLVLAGGVHGVIPIFQLAMAIAALLMFGKNSGLSLTAGFVVFDTALAWYQYMGGPLPVVFPLPVLSSWFVVCFAFFVIMSPARFIFQRFHETLSKSQELEGHLRFATAQLIEAQMLTNSGTFLYDVVQKSSMWSPGIYQVLGIPAPAAAEPWMFRPTRRMLSDFVTSDNKHAAEQCYVTLPPGQAREFVHSIRKPDGEIRYLRVRVVPENDADGKVIRVKGTVQDETGQHNYEVERQRVLDQIRSLSAHQEKVREEERKRIAREIHDELGQQLVGLKMRASYAAQKAGAGSPTARDIELIARQLAVAIRTVRDIATQLRPDILDHLGLVPALEWLAVQFNDNHRIPCATRLQPTDVNGDLATVIFRAAQEALTNVAKHAGATKVDLHLLATEENIQLEVADNGCGIGRDDIGKPATFGLTGLSERAAAAGGSLNISRAEEGGTVLRLVLPVTQSVRTNAFNHSAS